MNEKEVGAMLLNAMISGPGMKGKVKLPLEMNLKTAFGLCNLIYKGVGSKKAPAIFDQIPEDLAVNLEALADEIVQKADLADSYELLKTFQTK